MGARFADANELAWPVEFGQAEHMTEREKSAYDAGSSGT